MTPDKFTIQELYLDVGDGHQIYVQDWGQKAAKKPIVLLHGGPGNGSKNSEKAKFDPENQRVIFFDQRGSGKSLPYGSLKNNTTQDLVSDINKIADKLGIEKFVIAGGSWGACLALVYGIAHPDRLSGMVIQGVFTGSHDDIKWLDQGRFREFFPDAWDRYLEATPSEHHDNPSAYHFKRALGDDPVAAKASSFAYESLELSLLKLDGRINTTDFEDYDPSIIHTEIHYVANKCFLPDNYVLDNAKKLTMPVWIIQGRYDMVCRPITSYQLDQKLPNSKLIWTIDGHLAEHEASNILRIANRHLTGVL